MKQQISINILLSVVVFIILFIAHTLFIETVFTAYYITNIYYLIIYVCQSILLSRLDHSNRLFMNMYNATTMLKMVFSVLFLIIYFTFFAMNEPTNSKIQFIMFFVSLYFVYLIINVIQLFKT